MSDKNPKTLTYVSAFMLVILIVAGLYEARQRGRFRKTEAELIGELKQELEAPSAEQGIDEFPEDRWDPMLHAQLGRVAARLQEAINACVEKEWPNPPVDAQVRIKADPAGRLEALAVQGASDAAEACLVTVLARGQYPRKTDGVATLVLSYR